MNKWFYRTVGVASGVMLLGSGVAHAETVNEAKSTADPIAMRGLVADLLSPTGGLQHLGLSIDTTETNLLPELTGRDEGLPLGGLTGLTGGLLGGEAGGPLGGLLSGKSGGPLTGLTGGLLGGDAGGPLGALSGLTGSLSSGVLTDGPNRNGLTDGQTGGLAGAGNVALAGTSVDDSDQQAVMLDPALSRQLGDARSQLIPALIADAISRHNAGESTPEPGMFVDPSLLADEATTTEGLPIVDKLPLLGGLLGNGGPLDQFLIVGDLARNLPVVGSLSNGQGLSLDTVTNLPIAGTLLNQGLVKGGNPANSVPIVGSLPVAGDLLNGLTSALPNALPTGAQEPGRPPLAPSALPQVQQPIAQPRLSAPLQTVQPKAADIGRHRATGQHRARENASYTESTEEALPLLGNLAGGGLTGGPSALPVSGLVHQLPLVSELPMLNQLRVPLQLLRSLPLVGVAADLLPLESDTTA